jgi:hypothetical protein
MERHSFPAHASMAWHWPYKMLQKAQTPMRAPMRLFATVLAVTPLAGCAVSPEKLCAESVPDTWEHIGPDAKLSALLDASLPHARSVQHVWYRIENTGLLACTLARGARDNCSVRLTEFSRADGSWSKSREDAVLCNVLVSNRKSATDRWIEEQTHSFDLPGRAPGAPLTDAQAIEIATAEAMRRKIDLTPYKNVDAFRVDSRWLVSFDVPDGPIVPAIGSGFHISVDEATNTTYYSANR